MKRILRNNKNVLLLLVMLFLIFSSLQGCATFGTRDMNKISYQVLQSSKVTYDMITESINTLYKQKLLTDEIYKELEKYTDDYMKVHNTALVAIIEFKRGLISEEETTNKIVAVNNAITILLKIAQPYILKLDNGGK
jgi:hypothetical protein